MLGAATTDTLLEHALRPVTDYFFGNFSAFMALFMLVAGLLIMFRLALKGIGLRRPGALTDAEADYLDREKAGR